MKKTSLKKLLSMAVALMLLISVFSASAITASALPDTGVQDLGDSFIAALTLRYQTVVLNNNGDNTVSAVQYEGEVNAEPAAEVFTDSQLWKFEKQENGSYKITSQLDGKCLEVAGMATENVSPVAVWEDNGADCQRFFLYTIYGKYVLNPAHVADKVIDVNQGNFSVHIYDYADSSVNEQFHVEIVEVLDNETSEDVTSEDAISEDVTSEYITSEDATTEDTSVQDPYYFLDIEAPATAAPGEEFDVVFTVKNIKEELAAVEFFLDFDVSIVDGKIKVAEKPMDVFMTKTPVYTAEIFGQTGFLPAMEQICYYNPENNNYECRFLDLLQYPGIIGEEPTMLVNDGDLVVTIPFIVQENAQNGDEVTFSLVPGSVRGTTSVKAESPLLDVPGTGDSATVTIVVEGAETSEVVSDETSEVVSDETSEAVSDETSEAISDETSEAVSDETSEVVSDETSEVVSDETSEVVSDETSEVVSDETSDDTPDGELSGDAGDVSGDGTASDDTGADDSSVEGDESADDSSVEGDESADDSSVEGDESADDSSVEGDESADDSSVEGDESADDSSVEGDESTDDSSVAGDESADDSSVAGDESADDSSVAGDESADDSSVADEDSSDDATSEKPIEPAKPGDTGMVAFVVIAILSMAAAVASKKIRRA